MGPATWILTPLYTLVQSPNFLYKEPLWLLFWEKEGGGVKEGQKGGCRKVPRKTVIWLCRFIQIIINMNPSRLGSNSTAEAKKKKNQKTAILKLKTLPLPWINAWILSDIYSVLHSNDGQSFSTHHFRPLVLEPVFLDKVVQMQHLWGKKEFNIKRTYIKLITILYKLLSSALFSLLGS